MDNNIKVNINVNSNGTTEKETKKARDLKQAYTEAADAAGKVGGTAGSKSVASKLSPAGRPTSETIAQGMPPVGAQVQQYGQQRGAAGMTGADARDFANQAQGLGGLVRLYATYAANLFAVTAAFQALSRAMDTTNMVRGLDEIGAASGVALGGLSKQLVTATGGAISLREAMSATAKVTAAGLGQENVIRLGQVATKASQALGVDMTDAVNRLSRGITKLEPELLDELGIFTKIDPAVERYALRVGKAASQLTDFERRQAFANAVLEEGEKKFAAIQIDANPYNKLAASLANIAQQGLELVNKVLAPIINLLSSSPGALIAALVGVGGAIIKQAVPAFGLFRENIQRANQEASKAARDRAGEAVRVQRELNEKILKLTEARANGEILALDKAEARFKELREAGVASRAVKKVLKTEAVQDISEKQIQTIEKAAINARKKGLEEQAKVYDDLAVSIRNGQKAEQDYINAKLRNEQALLKDINSRRTIIGINQELAKSAEKASFKREIVSNAAYAGSLVGPINAIRLMNAEINASSISLGKFSTAMLISRGILAAFGGAAATLGTILLSAFGAITAIIGIGSLLASLFTNTAKESQATSEAFSQLEENTKNLGKTIDVINKKPYLEQFTAESVSARANALEGFAAALEKTNRAAQEEFAAMGILDKGVDIVKMLWGGDVQSKLTEETARGIANAFKDAQLNDSPAGKAAKETIAELLKVDPQQLNSFADVKKALENLSDTKAAEAIKQINIEFSKLGSESRKQASALSAIDEAFKKVTESRQKFTQNLLPSDDLTSFGRNLVSATTELERGLQNPEAKLQSIRRLFEEIKNVGGVSPDVLSGLQTLDNNIVQLRELDASLKGASQSSEELTKRQKVLEERLAKERTKTPIRKELDEIANQLKNLGEYEKTTLALRIDLSTSIQESEKLVNVALAEQFKIGSDLVANRLSTEFAKAGQTVTSALAGLLSGTEAGIRLRAQAEKAMLAVQLQQIKAQEAQIRATAENTIVLKQGLIDRKREQLRRGDFQESEVSGVENDIRLLERDIASVSKVLSSGTSYSKLAAERTQDIREGRESAVTGEALKLAESLEASRAAIANINAQSYAQQLKLEEELLKFAQRRGVENQQRDIQSLRATRDLAVANQAVFDSANQTGIAYRQNLDAQIRQREETLRQTNLLNQQDALQFARQKVSESNIADKKEQLALIDKELNYLKQVAEASKVSAEQREQAQLVKDRLELIEASSRNQAELLERNSRASQADLAIRGQKLTVEEKSFDILSKTINLSPEYIAAEEQILAKKRAQLEFDRQRQQLQDAFNKGILETQTAEEKILAQPAAEDDFAGVAAQVDQLDRIRQRREDINKTFRDGIVLQSSILVLAQREADARKLVADEQNKYNRVLEGTQSIGDSLRGIFEGLGSSADRFAQGVGTFAESFTKLGIQAEKNAKTIKALEEARDNPEATAEERTKIEEELTRAKRKQTKDELDGNIKLVSSAKMLFKEKSTGYKVLAGIEKAMHIAKLAMTIKEMFFDTAATGTSVANSATRSAASVAEAAVDGVKAVVKAISGLNFPANILAGAATAAVVGSLLSTIGGSSPEVSGGSASLGSAEKQQEIQGTAQTYNDEGKLVQFRRGALGDPSARSRLIETTLELLTDTSVDNLEVNNKMLEALYKIEAGIRGVSAGIYSIPGLAFGSIFGTQEGSSGRNILGGLFGRSTTTEIINSGLEFSGTLRQLSQNSLQLVDAFETVRTTSSRSILGFSRTRVSESTRREGLDEQQTPQARRLANYLNQTFSGAIDFLEATAEEAGLGQGVAAAIIDSLQLPQEIKTFSARGLKPEEMGEAFQAWLGGVMDVYGSAIFGQSFDEFARGGEEITETVARVIQTNKLVNQSFKNLGLEDFQTRIARLTGLTGVDLQVAVGRATQSLVDLAGGIENFTERAQFIAENFLTEAQRREATQQRLNTELQSLGLSGFNLQNRQEFVAIYDFINQQVAAGREGAAELSNQFANLAPLYDQLLPELNDNAEAIKSYVEDVSLQTSRVRQQARELQATDYAKSLQGFTDGFLETIARLKKEGTLTEETLAAAQGLLQAQQQLLDAQNRQKADSIIQNLNTELTNMNLGALGRELNSITTKSQDYVKQLVNLNQATDENIEAVRVWEATMLESARNTRREAQAGQYAQLFAGNQIDVLGDKFEKLGFALPANTKQLQFLIDGIDATTDAGLDLRGKLLDLGNEFNSLIQSSTSALRSAYDSRVQEVKGLQTQFQNFAKSIREFRLSLVTGALSVLTPLDKYQQTKTEFERIAAQAAQGDIAAMEKLQGASSSFLEASREVYASSELYTQDFNRVLQVLDNTTTVADLQIQLAENTLTEIKNVVGSIIDLTQVTQTEVAPSIRGLGTNLETALDNFAEVSTSTTESILREQIDAANANSIALGNVATGVVINAQQAQSNAEAIFALAQAQSNAAADIVQADTLNTQALIQAINQRLNQQTTTPTGAAAGGTGAAAGGAGAAAESYVPWWSVYNQDTMGLAGVAAQGRAFIGGVQAFAMGGIVESPTLFKFARGTGLMGEAGPEAIMPLRRTPSGSLGVIATQNNKELIEEIARLNQQVQQLTETVAQGAVINAQATDRNTEAITTTIKETKVGQQYMKKIQDRTSIV